MSSLVDIQYGFYGEDPISKGNRSKNKKKGPGSARFTSDPTFTPPPPPKQHGPTPSQARAQAAGQKTYVGYTDSPPRAATAADAPKAPRGSLFHRPPAGNNWSGAAAEAAKKARITPGRAGAIAGAAGLLGAAGAGRAVLGRQANRRAIEAAAARRKKVLVGAGAGGLGALALGGAASRRRD